MGRRFLSVEIPPAGISPEAEVIIREFVGKLVGVLADAAAERDEALLAKDHALEQVVEARAETARATAALEALRPGPRVPDQLAAMRARAAADRAALKV